MEELTAKEALTNQMGTVYEQTMNILSEPNLNDEDIKRARELNRIFLECYDRVSKDEAHSEEMELKHLQREAEDTKMEFEQALANREQELKEAEIDNENLRHEAEEKDKKADRAVKIGIAVVTGIIVPIGLAILTGKHSEKIALAETVSMIGTKEAFRATEKAFGDTLKNVGKII